MSFVPTGLYALSFLAASLVYRNNNRILREARAFVATEPESVSVVDVGLPGPDGPQGPAGAPGIAGAPGPAGAGPTFETVTGTDPISGTVNTTLLTGINHTLGAPSSNGFYKSIVNRNLSAIDSFVTQGAGNFVTAIRNGDFLYVGGAFRILGSVPVANIARYNLVTNVWSSLSGGVNGQVNSIIILGNTLYAFGGFTICYNGTTAVPANGIALYNLTTNVWSAFGNGTETGTGPVVAATGVQSAVFDSTTNAIIFAGNFTTIQQTAAAGGETFSASRIAAMDLTSPRFIAPNVGLTGGSAPFANTIVAFDNSYFVGGSFTAPNRLARYNLAGTSPGITLTQVAFTASSSFISGTIVRLQVIGGLLYASGSFPTARVAVYDPLTNSFIGIGGLTSSTANGIVPIDMATNNFLIYGSFSQTFSGITSSNLALVRDGTTYAFGVGLDNQVLNIVQVDVRPVATPPAQLTNLALGAFDASSEQSLRSIAVIRPEQLQIVFQGPNILANLQQENQTVQLVSNATEFQITSNTLTRAA